MNEESQQIGSSLLSIEANVIIAGLTAVMLGWFLYATGLEKSIWIPPNLGSDWGPAVYAIYTVVALLTIVMLGFAVEGLAGLLEEKAACHLSCYKKTDNPKHSQLTIWGSEYAYADFSRRRLRVLVARNTALCLIAFTILLSGIFVWKCQALVAFLALVVGLISSALFTYLWMDARKGLKNAIENASKATCNDANCVFNRMRRDDSAIILCHGPCRLKRGRTSRPFSSA